MKNEQTEKEQHEKNINKPGAGFSGYKKRPVGKTAAFWLKSRAAISCRHRFTALIYEK